ncbi:MAG TPA: universal stress protein [Longimicrobiales bacterium]|nr:universal stress protein [Longimicrobiales bacterium]
MIGRSIVVGVDGSDEASDAAALGNRLAIGAGGALHCVLAVSDPIADVAAARLSIDADQLHEELVAEKRRKVAERLSRVLGERKAAETLTARLGRPEHVLAEIGREVDADLFVIGGRRSPAGRPRLRRGTARHLMRTGEAPVLLTGPAGPHVDRVLAAVDLSFAAPPILRVATELASLLGVRLEGLHVSTLPSMPGEWKPALDASAVLEASAERAERLLWSSLPEGATGATVPGAAVPEILRVAGQVPHTLLVLGAQGHGWVHRLLLGSTAESLLDALPCSLAMIPVRPSPDG